MMSSQWSESCCERQWGTPRTCLALPTASPRAPEPNLEHDCGRVAEGVRSDPLTEQRPAPVIVTAIGALAAIPPVARRIVVDRVPLAAAVLPEPEDLAERLLRVVLYGVRR